MDRVKGTEAVHGKNKPQKTRKPLQSLPVSVPLIERSRAKPTRYHKS